MPVWRFLATNCADRKPTICDGIYELRIRMGSVNYRLLYFFHGQTVSVIAHGLTKEAAVTAADIKRAITRKAAFTANPTTHTFKGEFHDA